MTLNFSSSMTQMMHSTIRKITSLFKTPMTQTTWTFTGQETISKRAPQLSRTWGLKSLWPSNKLLSSLGYISTLPMAVFMSHNFSMAKYTSLTTNAPSWLVLLNHQCSIDTIKRCLHSARCQTHYQRATLNINDHYWTDLDYEQDDTLHTHHLQTEENESFWFSFHQSPCASLLTLRTLDFDIICFLENRIIIVGLHFNLVRSNFRA